MDEIITHEDAIVILGCSKETLAENLRTGNLPGTKFGVSYVIPRKAFFERLNQLAVEDAERRRKSNEPKEPFVPNQPHPMFGSSRRRQLVSM